MPIGTSSSLGNTSMSTIQSTPVSSGQLASASKAVEDCLRVMASEKAADSVFDPTSDLASSDSFSCYYNDDVSPDLVSSSKYATPSSIAVIGHLNDVVSKTPLRILFDTGSTHTYFYRQALPHGCEPRKGKRCRVKLLDTWTYASDMVQMKDIVLPEFSPTKHIPGTWNAFLAEGTSSFDIIFGVDFLSALKIDPRPSIQSTEWMGHSVPFRPVPRTNDRFRWMQQQLLNSVEEVEHINNNN